MQSTRIRTAVIVAAAVILATAAVGLVSLAGSLGGDEGKTPVSKAPAPAAASPGTVGVRLSDFKIQPAAGSAPAGKVTFVAKNTGATKHELVVIRTDKSSGALLDGKEASEAGAVDEIEDVAPGASKRLTVNLKAGRYALICNVPGHYKAGMFADFTVR